MVGGRLSRLLLLTGLQAHVHLVAALDDVSVCVCISLVGPSSGRLLHSHACVVVVNGRVVLAWRVGGVCIPEWRALTFASLWCFMLLASLQFKTSQ